MGTQHEIGVSVEHFPKNYKEIIYLAGRNCYGLESIENDLSEKRLDAFLYKIITNKHNSVLEHCHVSVYIKNVSRSLLAQITRHRLCSFSVKSQHFVKHDNFLYKEIETSKLKEQYHKLMDEINSFYKLAIKNGIPHYIAREVLPNSCLTNIFMTANVREWRHIIRTRITSNNTPEIRQLSKMLLINFYLEMPELFEDLRDAYLPDRPDLEEVKGVNR